MTASENDPKAEKPDSVGEPEREAAAEAGMNDDDLAAEMGQADDDHSEDPYRTLQETILDAALPHVAFDGWTQETLAQGALDAGLTEADAEMAFPRGPVDAVLLHATLADEAMAEEMGTLDLESMRTRDKVAIAIRVRLEAEIGNREAIRKGLRLLADPRHAAEAARSLAKTVDAVWNLAGDESTDFNYYSKRGLLAGVYSATLIYWLQDDSEDQARTWEFLTKRISEVLRIGQATAGVAKMADRLPNPFRLFGTGRRRWREGPVHR